MNGVERFAKRVARARVAHEGRASGEAVGRLVGAMWVELRGDFWRIRCALAMTRLAACGASR